jgi:hypothetical protein
MRGSDGTTSRGNDALSFSIFAHFQDVMFYLATRITASLADPDFYPAIWTDFFLHFFLRLWYLSRDFFLLGMDPPRLDKAFPDRAEFHFALNINIDRYFDYRKPFFRGPGQDLNIKRKRIAIPGRQSVGPEDLYPGLSIDGHAEPDPDIQPAQMR